MQFVCKKFSSWPTLLIVSDIKMHTAPQAERWISFPYNNHEYSLNTCITCSLHPRGLFIVSFESLTFLLFPSSSYFLLFSHKQQGTSYVGQRVHHVLILLSDRCPWINNINNKQSLHSIWSELTMWSYKNTLFVVFHEAGNNDPNLTEVPDIIEPQSINQTFRKSFLSP